MNRPCGPTPKSVWNKHRQPQRLSPQARSSRQRIRLRTKGKSKYPGGQHLI